MKNRIMALLLTMAMLISMVPAPVYAAEGAAIRTNEETLSGKPGDYLSFFLLGDNFENVELLEMTVHYDTDALELYYAYTSSDLYDSFYDINTNTPGEIKISAMPSQALSGSYLFLMSIGLKVKPDAQPGNYPVTVTVGEAYNSDLEDVSISGCTLPVTVEKKEVTPQKFSLGYNLSSYEVKQGDVWYTNLYAYSSFASGTFTAEYDRSLFALEEVVISDALLNNEYGFVDVNINTEGLVRISCIFLEDVYPGQFFTLKLRAIADVDTTTAVTVTGKELFKSDMTAYNDVSLSISDLTFVKQPEVPDYPNIWMTENHYVVGEQVSAQVMLEADSNVAAADFVINYDPAVMRCVSVTKAESLPAGIYLMINPSYSDGAIKFGYMKPDGVNETDLALLDIVWEPIASPESHFETSITGSGVKNADFGNVTLDYIPHTGCIYNGVITQPTCATAGYTTYTCAACGDSYQDDATTALGHVFAGDCDPICDRDCGYSRIPAADHTYDGCVDTECNVCGNIREENHPYSDAWTDDLTHHFHVCTECGRADEQTRALHQYTTNEMECSVCGHGRQVERIELISTPTKTEYMQGVDALDVSGGRIRVYYDDRNSAVKPVTADMVSGFSNAEDGKLTLTVTYAGKIDSYEVTVILATVTFLNWDGSVLSRKQHEYGTVLTDLPTPTKNADRIYTYRFSGWNKPVTAVAGDATYTAVFEPEFIEYVVQFVNDGKVISEEYYHYNDEVELPTGEIFKPSDVQYHYHFIGWDKAVTNVTGDAVYTAVYESELREYGIEFLDYDGTPISTAPLFYGSTVIVPSDPVRPADKNYTYTFTGWTPEVNPIVEGDATYVATYSRERIYYTVKFVDWDGTVLHEGEYTYLAGVDEPSDPVRAATDQYYYEFSGWDKEVTDVTESVTYTAVYRETLRSYTVNFLRADGTVYRSQTSAYGTPVNVPEAPEKKADNTYSYTFLGWEPEVTETVVGNATYRPVYQENYIDYDVVFLDYDGREISRRQYHYGDSVEIPDDPVRAADVYYTYEFIGWDPTVDKVTGSVNYRAQYEKNPVFYTVHFLSADGQPYTTMTYLTYGETIEAPEGPVKKADNTYTYTFTGWSPEFSETVTGNVDYAPVYKSEYIDYTVVFQDYDGTVLTEKTYHYGDTVELPQDPVRDADEAYTYAFAGWDKDVSSVTGNAVYTATYDAEYIDYVVTFYNDDGSIFHQVTGHYGDPLAAPTETPTKEANLQLIFTFSQWTPDVPETITGNMDIFPVFDEEYIEYIVTFLNDDGSVLKTQICYFNQFPTPPADPTKPADETYTYTFAGWDKEIGRVKGDTVYTATYTEEYIEYEIRFVDWDGTLLATRTGHYGGYVSAPSRPTRPADETYTYTFAGWDKNITRITGNTTYTATYRSAYINYTVTFKDYDGRVISEQTYHYGDTVELPRNPERADDGYNTYAFIGWSPDVTEVKGNAEYVAQYEATPICYTVIFRDHQDNIFCQYTDLRYGDIISAPMENPAKPSDETYSYTFESWDRDVEYIVHEDAEYYPIFSREYIDYTVEFYDWEDNLITLGTYHYGDVVSVPQAPVKPQDEYCTYTFAGWSPSVTTVRGDARYTAVYHSTPRYYTVTFLDADGDTYEEAEELTYGDTVTQPDEPPVKPSDKTYRYVFAGWDPEFNSTVRGDVTYTPVYRSEFINYTVRFVNDDGSVLSEARYHYGDAVDLPDDPTKSADHTYTYTFTGWDKDISLVTGDVTYTAVYESRYIDYTVRFVDWDGTVLSEKSYHYGDAVTVPEAPTRASDEEYHYDFMGWSELVGPVSESVTYYAQYAAQRRVYTITFIDWDGTEIGSKEYCYGDTVTLPESPDRPSDVYFDYIFDGWSPNVGIVTGNRMYQATYTATPRTYTVTFLDAEGNPYVTWSGCTYGDVLYTPTEPPVKAADATYTYRFVGWDKEVTSTVVGDATYTPVYEQEYIDYTVRFADGEGNTIFEATYHYGDSVTVPQAPDKEGYTFTGWTPDVTAVTGNTIYTAMYERNYLPGDINGDGIVNNKDAIRLNQYLAGWEVSVVADALDVNGDGISNNKDAIRLNQYLAGWSVEIY